MTFSGPHILPHEPGDETPDLEELREGAYQ
jgi:hypothetical protein